MTKTAFFDHTHTLRALTPHEHAVSSKTLIQNIGLKPNESLLIVTDSEKKDREAALFFEAAKEITSNVTLAEIPTMTENAQEPPSDVTSMMKKADVVLLITSFSLTHTHASEDARASGTRSISMPGISYEVIMRTLGIDYSDIAARSNQVAAILSAGHEAILTSPLGTEVIFGISGRTAVADTGFFTQAGDGGNLPAGEAFLAPVEGTTNGIIVFDGSFADIVIDEPITLVVKQGHAIDIRGGEGARLLNTRLARVGKDGYNIAELGVGTNDAARINSILLEVEKVFETVHVALGNSKHIGGEVDIPFHSDGVILSPTLAVDGHYILKDGKFML